MAERTTRSARTQDLVPALIPQLATVVVVLSTVAFLRCAVASENVPHRPFAQWADVLDQGQFVAGLVYEQSDAYNVWAGGQQHSVKYNNGSGDYGIHINQGFLALQYGITERWALDFNFGATIAAWRYFDNGVRQTTQGIMDWSFGARYQLFKEDLAQSAWIPTLTFRAGAVLPGSYNEDFIFAPGLRSAAIEPELLLRKHFGWQGLGGYGDGLYRWNRTTGNDQYLIALGLFQQFKQWEVDFGWRHLQTLSGNDIIFNPDGSVVYPRDTRENSDSIEAGISFTSSHRHNRYAFQMRAVLEGNNTDDKFWLGVSVDFPFGGNPKPPDANH